MSTNSVEASDKSDIQRLGIKYLSDSTNRNVLMITGSYYPDVTGGAEQCRLLIESLKETFHFFVLTTANNVDLDKNELVNGVAVSRILLRPRNGIDYIIAIYKYICFFFWCNKNFQIVHLHGFTTKSILLIFLAKLFKKKVIVKMSSVGFDDPLSLKKRGFLLYKSFSKADTFVGISEQFKTLYEKSSLPRKKFVLIPNGVDTDRYSPVNQKERDNLRSQLGLPSSMKIILFVGHFSREKCPNVVFDAWKRLANDTRIDSGIVFIGATDEEHHEVDPKVVDEVRKSVAPFVGDRVFFVERTREIEKYYQSADVYVMPTLREGMPNALLEAMSCELPVVISRLEGITDWVVEDSVNGLLVSPGSVEETSRALARLIGDTDLSIELAKNARKTIIERFTVRNFQRQYTQLYLRTRTQ